MRRGAIVTLVGNGSSPKPPAGLIVQSDAFTASHPALTLCPMTSTMTGNIFNRVPIAADPSTELPIESEIEINPVQAVRRNGIGQVIGIVPRV